MISRIMTKILFNSLAQIDLFFNELMSIPTIIVFFSQNKAKK